MWDEVGIMRNKEGLENGLIQVAQLKEQLLQTGFDDDDRVFNLTWHDWLNTRSLLEISEVIASAALSRENSRGAHFREDFPDEGELENSYFTRSSLNNSDQAKGTIRVERKKVDFTIIKPGETLVEGM